MAASQPSMRHTAVPVHTFPQPICATCRTCCNAPADGIGRGGLRVAHLVNDSRHRRHTCGMWLHHLDSGYKLHKMNASKLCELSRHSCLKTPNKSRKIKTSKTQSPKKRRRRHHHNRAGYEMRAYACLRLSVVALLWKKFGNTCDAWAAQLVQRLLVQPFSNLPLHSRNSRYRVQLRLPLQNGRDLNGRPIASEASPKGQYSRPGPKSGMGRMLLIMLFVVKCQLSHGVRVPTHSVGVGEGSPQVNTRTHCMPKTNGIQVTYGKQDPTHAWNKYVKRSFKRAYNRAVKHGQASYRGKVLTVKHAPEPASSRTTGQHPSLKHPQRRLRVFCYNVGGLGSGMYEDLMGFLDQSHYDVVLVQETKLRVDSEYVTTNWICVGSGTESQKQAGVMVMIRKAITNVAEVRHDTVIPGRLLRVRFPLGNDGCKLSVICAY